jgi:hypothetical protein
MTHTDANFQNKFKNMMKWQDRSSVFANKAHAYFQELYLKDPSKLATLFVEYDYPVPSQFKELLRGVQTTQD